MKVREQQAKISSQRKSQVYLSLEDIWERQSASSSTQPRPPPSGTITTLLDHLNRRPSLHANLLRLQRSQPFLSVPSTDKLGVTGA